MSNKSITETPIRGPSFMPHLIKRRLGQQAATPKRNLTGL
jgi:hypothetical protein